MHLHILDVDLRCLTAFVLNINAGGSSRINPDGAKKNFPCEPAAISRSRPPCALILSAALSFFTITCGSAFAACGVRGKNVLIRA